MMNVLLISTSEQCGGGAIAARRLMDALNKSGGVKAKMLVRDKQSDDKNVVQVGCKLPKLLERLSILPYVGLNRSRLWQVDFANTGISITDTKEFQEADIIHLHWVNQGMVSLDEMGKIMSSGKRVVWTLHDEWPYLGICHYRGDCSQFDCQECHLVRGNVAHRTLKRKLSMYKQHHPTFVGCSQWITRQARLAMPEERVEHINNCIPADTFFPHPNGMKQVRQILSLPTDKQIVLFCCQNVADERKGMAYLVQALQKLSDSNTHLVIVGKGSERMPLPDGIGATHFGPASKEQMPLLYNAADVFVTPSLQDNLPNTIAEAMTCSTPCVGFNVGGIPEMIDHLSNGYAARYRDANDLAEGIRYVLKHNLRQAAHMKALSAYGEAHVAQQYINIYKA